MHKRKSNLIGCFSMIFILVLVLLILLGGTSNKSEFVESNWQPEETTTYIENLNYSYFTSMGVPNINSSFKSWMDYRTITNKNSPQFKLIQRWGWTDSNGFIRCAGERDLGIYDDYYFIALGSYYGTEIGRKYRITLDTGRVFYGVLGDCKANIHTNNTHQYSVQNNNIVEFIVDSKVLNKDVKKMGSANVYSPLNGSIISIEKIDFKITTGE